VVTWLISALLVATRFYTRTRIIYAINWSDWCILIALVFSGATSAGEIQSAVHGSGRHLWDLPLTDLENGRLWGIAAWYALLFYGFTLTFSKISILLLYIHIFAFQWVRRSAQIIMAIVIITGLWNMCTTLTACIPLEAYWDLRVPATFCHVQNIWWSNLGMLMVTDFLIFLLPIPVVWKLKMPKRQKYILLGIFGLGFMVCLVSILRVRYVADLINTVTDDFFYRQTAVTYWTLVEVNGAITCACLMTVKPLVARLFPRLFSSAISAPSEPGSDRWIKPPTIGSKPSRDPLNPGNASARQQHPRDSLEDIYEEHGAGAFATDPEKAAAMADEDGGIGMAVSVDSSASTKSESGDRGKLSPPPITHLRPPQARHSGGAFYESASDNDMSSAASSGPHFGAGHTKPQPQAS